MLKLFSFIFLSFSILSFSQSPQKIYVSANSEINTLAKAYQSVLDNPKRYRGEVVIEIQEGSYYQDKAVEVTTAIPCKSLSIQAEKGKNVVLHGGKQIKNWKQHQAQVYVADFEGEPFRQLYVEGKRATRCRMPNKGEHFLVQDWDLEERTILAEKLPFQLETTEENPTEMVILMSWAEAILRIKSTSNNDKHTIITPLAYERDLVFKRMWPKKWKNLHYILENRFEFIDQAYEWYFDREKNKVYIQLPKGLDPNTLTIIAPQTPELLKITGQEKSMKNISIQGIDFQYTNWTRAFEYGMLDIQSGQYNIPPTLDNNQYIGRPIAALTFNHVNKSNIRDCHFSNLGAAAIDINKGCSDIVVEGNSIKDIAGNGIMIAQFSSEDHEIHTPYFPPKKELTEDITISNNYITRVAQDYYGAIGITAGFTRGLIVRHNHIEDVPYTAISMGWGWLHEKNIMKNNSIENNYIHNAVNYLADGGAIYTLSPQPNSFIKNNYMSNIKISAIYQSHSPNSAIYCDEGSSGFTISNNLYPGCVSAVKIHQCGEIKLMEDNYTPRWTEIQQKAGLQEEYKKILKRK